MEVAGAALAIAGIPGLFSTALESFDYIISAATLGKVHEVLQVKIEVEKIRLLIWGQSIGLDGPAETQNDAINKALEPEYLRNAVASLLACFVKILEESKRLRERYGLVERIDPHPENTDPQLTDQRLLGSIFKPTYDKYKGNSSERQHDASLTRRTRWAVADERRFRHLAEELKAINNSLSHLLPAIRDRVRVRMRTEIMRSTNHQQLQRLASASEDADDTVAETASLRLEVLSGTSVSVRPRPAPSHGPLPAHKPVSSSRPAPELDSSDPGATRTTLQTSVIPPVVKTQPDDSNSQNIYSDLSIGQISSQPDSTYDNTGVLIVHKVFTRTEVPSFFSWLLNVESSNARDPKISSTQTLAFDLYRLVPGLRHSCQRLLETDVEADPEYPGWAPASVSLTGLSREYGYRRLRKSELEPKKWPRAGWIPPVTPTYLSKRWSEIVAQGGLGAKWTEEIGYQEVKALLGDAETVWLDPNEKYKMRHQISNLLASLSMEDQFPSFELVGFSIGALANRDLSGPRGTYGATDFLYQMLQAKECSLRIERGRVKWTGGISRKIVYDMIAAELWMSNVEMSMVAHHEMKSQMREDVARKQTDAMILFAEQMKWPYLTEVRSTCQSFMTSAGEVNPSTWNWIAGLVFPGAIFALSLMLALHQACTTLRRSPAEQEVDVWQGNFGIVFTQVSYWRNRSIIGRVLAAFPGINEIGGWIGPCIAPTGLQTSHTPATLVSIHTREPTLRLQGITSEELQRDPLDAHLAWKEPPLPPRSAEVCVLRKLEMLAVATAGFSGPFYRAKLDFYLVKANKVITLTLNSGSIFIAAPPCRGKHLIDPQLNSIYACSTYEVSQLDRAELRTDGITVINATGHGTQALARAWCAEKGTSAVICKHKGECCYKCGLMLAGKEGVDVGVLILC